MPNARPPISPIGARATDRSRISAAYWGAARRPWVMTFALTGGGEPERVGGVPVTPNFFRVLGVTPALGRDFLPREEWRGQDDVVMLGDGLWRRRFGAEQSVVGRTISLDGRPRTVVGVLPPGFRFDDAAVDLWIPTGWTPQEMAATRRPHFLRVVGRLKDGVSVEQAGADLHAIAADLQRRYPATNTHMDVGVGPLRDWIVGPSRTALLVFLGAVAFVLLVACANVANLMLARAASRRHEVAVRTALGAGAARLARQMLTESLLLSALGGGLGLLVAYAAVRGVVAAGPAALPRLDEIAVDRAALLMTMATTLTVGVLFGLLPAWQGSAREGTAVVRGPSRADAAPGSMRARNLLIVTEVALSLALLTGAALLVRSFWNLSRVDLGFVPERAVAVQITLPRSVYRERDAQRAFVDRLLDRVRAVPGVSAAGASQRALLDGLLWTSDFTIEHRPPGEFGIQVRHDELSPGYLGAIGARVVTGRDFTDADRPPAPLTVLVNEALVRRYFRGEDPIGHRLNFDRPGGSSPWRTIVGVVRDFHEETVDGVPPPTIYEPLAQNTDLGFTLVVRTPGAPSSLAPTLRAIVHDLDPDIPVPGVQALAVRVDEAMEPRRFTTLVMGLFAGGGLLLAMVGLYGVLSYLAGQRTHEIGVRMALGADGGDVARLVARQAVVVVGIGLALGLGLALAVARVMQGLLFGVRATDPATYAVAVLGLAGVATLAMCAPIRRAMRVDPAAALRAE